MLPNKWQFDTSQDLEVLGDNFNSDSSDIILDGTLQALGFHFFPLGYFKKRLSQFINVTKNLDLTIEQVENGQLITNTEDEKLKKQNERVTKRKM